MFFSLGGKYMKRLAIIMSIVLVFLLVFLSFSIGKCINDINEYERKYSRYHIIKEPFESFEGC